ncbi:S8 family peptidase [Peristeroidobacter agariperforans]|uniref:S8 family peptidase n=1 Tax=Peristeroidobacter agariperforans TaxID=268404 RepID=UPI00101CD398|nr:S8 family peptidase [Peristeroidobacter agariperforans]
MGKFVRRKRWLLGAGALGAALTLFVLAPREETSATPTPAPPRTSETPSVSQPAPVVRVATAPQEQKAPVGVRQSYIVQASSAEIARSAVLRAGGVITGDLGIIRAVGAELDDRELASLWSKPVDGLRVYDDASVTSSSTTSALPETYYPTQVGASPLHTGGITGRGVTVAVLDTGVWQEKGPLQVSSSGRNPRVLAQYDVLLARQDPNAYPPLSLDKYSRDIDDLNGHGTHISSIIASSGIASTGKYQGVAPGVNLVSVRVLDNNGMGRYFDVISGIQWAVNHRLAYGIRVLNLSLSAPVQSHYWDDPLNQAVMAAWGSGIVVVVAAGNAGPAPMTIGVPANNPYVISVGAVTDAYHPYEPAKYKLATFSSAGPTYEGFVKPEVVAMGGHIRAYAPDDGTLAQMFPQWVDTRYPDMTMSGTSQAAAVTSGVVALMLERNPSMSPNTVKCRLMDGARPAVRSDGHLAYSVFQQGAGLVNAQDALYSTKTNCANQGLNVAADLAGIQHYGGRANQDADGNFYIMEVEEPVGLLTTLLSPLGSLPLLGQLLVGLATALDGLLWDGSPPTHDDVTWSGGYIWSNGFTWSNGYVWSNGYIWSNTDTSGSPSASSSSSIDPAPQE